MYRLMTTLIVAWAMLGSASVALGQATDVECSKCVDTGDIAADAISSWKLRNRAVTASKIAPDAVTTSKIDAQAVTTAKIRNGAVTDKKLSPELAVAIAGFSSSTAANAAGIQAIEGSIEGIEGELEKLDRLAADHEVLVQSTSSTELNLHFPTTFMGDRMYTCGQMYLFGCQKAESGNGTEFENVTYSTRTNSFAFNEVNGSGPRLWAVPTVVWDFSEIRFVGEANLYGSRGMGRILVDDCDNPTAAFLDKARNPRSDDTGPDTIMNNAGLVYSRDSEIPTLVDVAGNTYGVMNFIQTGDPSPICTPGVSDRTGIWERYTYSFAEDTNDVRFAGPSSYVGFTTGLIDQVAALEARIAALEAAAQ